MRRRSARRSRRRSTTLAEIRPLEPRLLMDGGGAASGPMLAAPSKFATVAEFDQYLIDREVVRYQAVLGTSFPDTGDIEDATPTGFVWADDTISGTGAATASAPGTSPTNDQVQGVAEGDLVENDGRYLYILTDQALKVVDALNPSAPALASTTALDGQPIAEYLDGSRLTVITQQQPAGDDFIVSIPGVLGGGFPISHVKVTEFDVSDPANPTTIRATTMDGVYVSSRAVGDEVYVLLQSYLPELPGPSISQANGQATYQTEAAYRASLATLVPMYPLPRATSVVGVETTSGPLIDPTAIYKPASPTDDNLTVVAAFDALSAGPGPTGAVGVVASEAPVVYATPTHLDLFSTLYAVPAIATPSTAPITAADAPSTVIRQFTLDGDHIDLTATGDVPGTVLDQFSADESGGNLRLVTTENAFAPWVAETDTSGALDSFAPPTTTNDLFVLADQGGTLTTVGSLRGLSPGEPLDSARFFGDRAYLATFRQIDPLIAVDLSDPANPTLGGTLQIPGVSRYLQPIDATHLIAIGQDVDPSTNEPTDVVVSLYDVSDLANPKRVDSATISTGGWYWPTTGENYDHHQVSYFPETQTLAIPVNAYTTPSDLGPDGQPNLQNSLFVFKVDPTSGFTPIGTVAADTNVLRGTRIGDTLLTISQDMVTASPLSDPSTILGKVQIADPNDFPPPFWAHPIWDYGPPLTPQPATPSPTPDPIPPPVVLPAPLATPLADAPPSAPVIHTFLHDWDPTRLAALFEHGSFPKLAGLHAKPHVPKHPGGPLVHKGHGGKLHAAPKAVAHHAHR